MNRRGFLRLMGVAAIAPAVVKFVPKPLRDAAVEHGLGAPPDARTGTMLQTPKAFVIATDRGWVKCDGRTLPTAEYPELAKVLRYAYGGKGPEFNIPDMRRRIVR